MRETMIKGDGVGLAAPQVGVLKRVVVVDVNGMYLELINPEIVASSGNQCKVEGCLSVKGVSGYVDRPLNVSVKAMDRYGKPFMISGTELLAQCLCHEIDHLNGVLFIDHIKDKKDAFYYMDDKDNMILSEKPEIRRTMVFRPGYFRCVVESLKIENIGD